MTNLKLTHFLFGTPEEVAATSNPMEQIQGFAAGESNNASKAHQQPIKKTFETVRTGIKNVFKGMLSPFQALTKAATHSAAYAAEAAADIVAPVVDLGVKTPAAILAAPGAIIGNTWQKIMAIARLGPNAINVGFSYASQGGLRLFSGSSRRFYEAGSNYGENAANRIRKMSQNFRDRITAINFPGHQWAAQPAMG